MPTWLLDYLILSCVILGLNPVLPVLHIYIFLNHDLSLYGFYQIKYIHTYLGTVKWCISRGNVPEVLHLRP